MEKLCTVVTSSSVSLVGSRSRASPGIDVRYYLSEYAVVPARSIAVILFTVTVRVVGWRFDTVVRSELTSGARYWLENKDGINWLDGVRSNSSTYHPFVYRVDRTYIVMINWI